MAITATIQEAGLREDLTGEETTHTEVARPLHVIPQGGNDYVGARLKHFWKPGLL